MTNEPFELLPYLVPVFLASVLLTAGMIQYARRTRLEDIPNERSSHARPTPRGGGVAIVATFLAGALWIAYLPPSFVPVPLAVAAVGWWDDRKGLGAAPRLAVHLIAAFLFAWFALPQLGLPAQLLAALFVAWMTNIYNFMDGIDGIAALEGITAGSVLAFLCYQSGDALQAPVMARFFLLLVAACAGFFCFNRAPARIFMGDVGSGFLGFVFGALVLAGAYQELFPLASGLIALMAFLADSGATFLRRALRGQAVWKAHREHAYQHAVKDGHGHGKVSAIYAGVNVLVLGPMAWLAQRNPEQAWAWCALSAALLSAAALRFRAGAPAR